MLKKLRKLGPGLITGASKNDPASIATYAKIGAQSGVWVLWPMLFTYPLLAVIQEISARTGRATGCGLAGNARRHLAPAWGNSLVVVLFTANLFNLGADIAAMGAAMRLLVGGPALLWSVALAALALLLQVQTPYSRYVAVLKWLAVALLAYVVAAFVIRVNWTEALQATVWPTTHWHRGYWLAVLAAFGATVNPYLLVWQASQEVEEIDADDHRQPLKEAPLQTHLAVRRIRWDTYIGMAFSNVVGFFIILTTAATLHAAGKTDLQSAAEAAAALEPFAGRWATWLWAAGMIGAGMLAVPVLAGSAAYAVGETCGWRTGLERHWTGARRFYATLAAGVVGGVVLNFLGIDPIQAMFWASLVNGVAAAPVMILLMLIGTNRHAMGAASLSLPLRVLGWSATAIMAAIAVGIVALSVGGQR